MSAPNFWIMDDFDLYVVGNGEVLEMYKECIEEEKEWGVCEIDDTERAWDLFNFDLEDYIQPEIDNLNEKLQWFKVKLKSGYYEGVQFYIDTDYVSVEEWEDDEAYDYFGLPTVEDLKKLIEEEKAIINAFLEDSKWFGFRKLVCDGIFSNGEAIYHYA